MAGVRPDVRAEAAESTKLVLTVIGSLYITQGIPVGMSMVALPTLLRQGGVSMNIIALASVAMLPWVIKFLWAPIVDNHGSARFGHRKSWILPLQVLVALLLVSTGLLPFDESGQWLVIAIALIANLASATQDIATDGLAVEKLSSGDHETALAWANGMQVGGFAAGMCIGGPLVLILGDRIGQPAAFAVAGIAVLAALIPILLWRESPQGEVAPDRRRAKLRRFFRHPHAALMLAVAFIFNTQQMMVSNLMKPFLVDAGASASLVGIVSGLGIILIAISAGLLGSVIVARFGIWRSAVTGLLFASLAAGGWIVIASMMWTGPAVILTVAAASGLFSGVAYVAFFALFMRWAAGDQAGTDFTILQCAESCGGMVLQSIAAVIAGYWGFTVGFAAASAVGILALLVILGPARQLAVRASRAPLVDDTDGLDGEGVIEGSMIRAEG